MSEAGQGRAVITAIRVTQNERMESFWVDDMGELPHKKEQWRYKYRTFADGINRIVVYIDKAEELGIEAATAIARQFRAHPSKSTLYRGCRANEAHTRTWGERKTIDLSRL